MKIFRNLTLALILTLSVAACSSSKGEGTYFRTSNITREDNGRTIYMQGKIKDNNPETLPENHSIVYPDAHLVEIYKDNKLVNQAKYRPAKTTEASQITQERGPWFLTEYTIYWGNGEIKKLFKSTRNNLWTEKLYNANGSLAEETKYRDGVMRTDSYRGKGRIFDSKFVNPKRINDAGLEESLIEYYDEDGHIRIKEYWQANFTTQNGETFRSGETLRLRELKNAEEKVVASWYKDGDPRNVPDSKRLFDRLFQEAINITSADQRRGDQIEKAAKENQVGTITNDQSKKTENKDDDIPTLTPDKNGVLNLNVNDMKKIK